MRDASRAARASLPWLISVAVTLAVLGLCLEGAARLFLPQGTSIRPISFDPQVGLRFVPHATVRETNGLEFDVTETANAAGFLDRELPAVEKPFGACRVAFFGDSFVEASQVTNEHKVQALFERMAQRHWLGLDVETMALGFGGTGQLNQLAYYDQVAQPLKPDVVVLVVVNNDLADNSSLISALRQGFHPHHAPLLFAREAADEKIEIQPIDPDWRAHMLPLAVHHQPWWHRHLHASSRFYQWLFLKLSLLYPWIVRDLGWRGEQRKSLVTRARHLMAADPEFAKVLSEVNGPELPNVEAMRRELYAMFRKGDDMPALYAQAIRFTSFAFDEFKRRGGRDGFELIALSVAGIGDGVDAKFRTMIESKGIPYLSQEAYIGGLGEPLAKALWPHDGHWTRQGHVWAAEQLLDHFARTGLCGRPPKPLR